MVLTLVALLSSLAGTAPDTTPTYSDAATRELVERAMARHRLQDTLVADFHATLRYRISFGLGKRAWDRVPTAAVEEQEGTVTWQRPNDLKIEILGRRAMARDAGLDLHSLFDHPWFVPREIGDSVRAFGEEFPEQAALHPLAGDGPEWYRYAITDSVQLRSPDGTGLRAVRIRVLPARPGAALVAGNLWIDRETAEVVRFSFQFVGRQLWVKPDGPERQDTTEARRANGIISRILTLNADLEYALQDGRYWMPYRQLMSGRVRIPLVGDLVIPFESETRFDDYAINTGRPFVFTVALLDRSLGADSVRALERTRRDSIRADRRRRAREGGERVDTIGPRDYAGTWTGGRYEIHRAPAESLARYPGWADSLVLDRAPAEEEQIRQVQAELARLADGLPAGLSGRPRGGLDYERLADVLRYNRVQGVSLGGTYAWRPPGTAFTTLKGSLRYGLTDNRLLARLAVERDGPGGRLTWTGYRDLADSDPWGRGRGFANTFNAIFSAHDNADYYLAQGGSLAWEHSLSRGLDLTLAGRVEHQTSVSARATSGVNDLLGGSGEFPPNPAITEGTFGGVSVRLEGYAGRVRWLIGADGLAGADRATGRLYGEWRQPAGSARAGLVADLRGGIATAPTLEQAAYRLGGPGTVRGFEYGTRRGQAFWSLQLDWALSRKLVRPVLFSDAGQIGPARSLFGTEVLVGAGAGLSLFNGLVRFDLSHPITPGAGGLRFDLALRGVR